MPPRSFGLLTGSFPPLLRGGGGNGLALLRGGGPAPQPLRHAPAYTALLANHHAPAAGSAAASKLLVAEAYADVAGLEVQRGQTPNLLGATQVRRHAMCGTHSISARVHVHAHAPVLRVSPAFACLRSVKGSCLAARAPPVLACSRRCRCLACPRTQHTAFAYAHDWGQVRGSCHRVLARVTHAVHAQGRGTADSLCLSRAAGQGRVSISGCGPALLQHATIGDASLTIRNLSGATHWSDGATRFGCSAAGASSSCLRRCSLTPGRPAARPRCCRRRLAAVSSAPGAGHRPQLVRQPRAAVGSLHACIACQLTRACVHARCAAAQTRTDVQVCAQHVQPRGVRVQRPQPGARAVAWPPRAPVRRRLGSLREELGQQVRLAGGRAAAGA